MAFGIFFMRHELPADVKGREKIIGGLLDVVQAMWLILFLVIAAGIFALLYQVLNMFALVIALPVAFGGIPFAFIKKDELTLFQYMLLGFQYKHKVQILIKDRRF